MSSNIHDFKLLNSQLADLISELTLLQKGGDCEENIIYELESKIKVIRNKINRYKNNDTGIKKSELQTDINMLTNKYENGKKNNWSKSTMNGIIEAIKIKQDEIINLNKNPNTSYNSNQDDIDELEEEIDSLLAKRDKINRAIEKAEDQLNILKNNTNKNVKNKPSNSITELDNFDDDDDQTAVWNRQLAARSEYQKQYGKAP